MTAGSDDSSERIPAPAQLILESVLAAVLILGPAIAVGIAADVTLGSIADWVAALATLGALIAATQAARVATRVFRLERSRDDRYLEMLERAQAEKIGAWIGTTSIRIRTSLLPELERSKDSPAVDLRNASDLPVQHIHGRVFSGHTLVGTFNAPAIGPGDEQTHRIEADPDFLANLDIALAVEITFVDAAGREWRRNTRGDLKRVEF